MDGKRRGFVEYGDDAPTEAEMLAGLVQRSSKIEEFGAAFAVSVRVPLYEYYSVKALAQRSGKSTNTMFVHLVRVGLESLANELDDSDVSEIGREASRLMHEARKQDQASRVSYQAEDGEQAA